MKALVPAALGVIFFSSFPTSLLADGPADFSKTPFPSQLVPPDAKVTLGAMVCFLEGPAVDAEGNVFFSNITANAILKMNPHGDISVFRGNSGRTNGNCFDALGRLVSCEGFGLGPGGRRRVVRTDMKTGLVNVLTERYQGKRYNSPNDLCSDASGRIWFTDPAYGDRSHVEMNVQGVYRIEANLTVTRVLQQPEVQKPNGITLSPDGHTLYVMDVNDVAGGNRKIWAFTISANGDLSDQRQVYDFQQARGGDGMRTDMDGNLWVAGGMHAPRPSEGESTEMPQGVYVISPNGKLLGRVPIPEDIVTNVAFGGPDRKTLYVTAGTSIYKFPVSTPGYAVYPPLRP